jgi:aminopeptidase-like protein
MNKGLDIFNLAKKLWPLNRSISGDGLRRSLKILKTICPEIKIKEIPSGEKVFDWSVPDEWKINSAYIITPTGKKICDFKKNNLHVLNYSIGIKKKITLKQLNKKLYSIPSLPKAIPYKTSYYNKDWGFCISHDQKNKLKNGIYKINIDAQHFKGSMSYGEMLIKGKSKKEILLSTYICHPSMANNELSGPCVSVYLARWIQKLKKRKYSYRIVFLPETIGSIAYISKNLKRLKKNVVAGFNLTCLGDDKTYSYLPSKNGSTLSDNVAKYALRLKYPKFKKYKWIDRGSDERQYCSPGIDLPIATIMRTKYGEYKEYHTSMDNLTKVVKPKGLQGSYDLLKLVIKTLEKNIYLKSNILCEPNLGKRGLYPKIGGITKLEKSYNKIKISRSILDVLSYADGRHSLLDIMDKCNIDSTKINHIVKILKKNKLVTVLEFIDE